MRRKRENQLPLSSLWTDHRLAQEIRAVSNQRAEKDSHHLPWELHPDGDPLAKVREMRLLRS